MSECKEDEPVLPYDPGDSERRRCVVGLFFPFLKNGTEEDEEDMEPVVVGGAPLSMSAYAIRAGEGAGGEGEGEGEGDVEGEGDGEGDADAELWGDDDSDEDSDDSDED